jgi:predicted MFS family arabinose efflux permease
MVVAVRTLRTLPETRRFEHDDHVPEEHEHQHMRASRLLLLAAGMFFLNIFTAPTQQLQTDYLRNTRGMGSGLVAVFILATNTWGFIGIAAGAQLADRSSRRLAATIGLVGLAVGNSIMFSTSGVPMWLGSLVGSLVGAAVVPSLGALLPELFPTLRRGAANGLLNGAAVIGSMVGLFIVGQVVTHGNYGPTTLALATGPIIVAGLVWRLPETAGVELETLNPDD